MTNFNNQYQQLFNEKANNLSTESSNVHLKKQYFEKRLRLQHNHKSEIDITKPNFLTDRATCDAKQIFILPKPQVKKMKNQQREPRRHSSVELYSSDIPVYPVVLHSYRYQFQHNGEETDC
ncbi:hypothetical protein Bhyg_05077 [Pseudolycoriella hygida]|uniref:Uncharacterized protein n=1 Tax=Pseudolycoriella hygida TaxID=35572 RepID=A0A9Q0NHK0_9DIPT|nr:hypothetical protein Bhyg_05077 [Pseudolycoriella hygida]